MKKENFKAIQREWDQKLKDSGFVDIEDRNSPREMLKQWHSTMFIHRFRVKGCFDPEAFSTRQNYFEIASHLLATHNFESEIHKEVWRLHTEGESLRKIAKQMTLKGHTMSKDGALKILRLIQKAMKG